ncbi:MAG: SLC26A/SulP transporter family protein [Elusimicrobia bacterium]|nr:SLC26A/SulP transporter family protein [Elusimicrobiota bacterium]
MKTRYQPYQPGDIWGGTAAALVVLPQSIAFGVAVYAALGPAYAAYGALAGFLGAAAIGSLAASTGGAPRLISTPCAPAAAVMAPLCAAFMVQGQSPERVMVLLVAVGLMVGLLQIVYGLLGGGRLIKYIPYPVVTGYLSGVAILIVLGQGPRFLGLPKGMALSPGLWTLSAWNLSALAVGAATIACALLGPRLTKKVPAVVLGLLGGILAYAVLALWRPELRGLAGNALVIGPLGGQSAGFGAWTVRWSTAAAFGLSDLKDLVFPALTLSFLLSIDTLKTCVVLDAMTGMRHKSDRELMGQGLGNAVSGLIGGMPGAGAMAPTVVNLSSGGQTRLSGVVCAGSVAALFLLCGRAVAWLPFSALAGMLIVLAGRMFDWHSFTLLRRRATWFDFAVAAAVAAVAVTVDLVAASGVGLALAILLFIRDQMKSSVVRRRILGSEVSSKERRLPAEADILAKEGDKICIMELQGSLFFGTADQLYTEVEPEFERRRYIIFDMSHVTSVDFTAAHMLEIIETRIAKAGGRLLFADIPKTSPTGQDLALYLKELGLAEPERRAHLFPSLDEAFTWAEDRILAKHPDATEAETPLALEEIELLKGMEPELLAALRPCVGELALEPGQVVFQQGDTGADEMYFIRSGKVRVDLTAGQAQRHLATFARGDFFGEMAFLDRQPRSAAAKAHGAARLFVLCRSRFDEAAPRQPDLGRKFFWRLCRAMSYRLRQADAEIRALHEA